MRYLQEIVSVMSRQLIPLFPAEKSCYLLSLFLSSSIYYQNKAALAQVPISSPSSSTDLNLLNPVSEPLQLPTQIEAVKEKKIIKITLKQALALAIQNNRQLQVTQKQLTQANLNVGIAEASYWPSLGLGINLNSAVYSINSAQEKFYNNLYSSIGLDYAQSQNITIYNSNSNTLQTANYSLTLLSTAVNTLDTTLSMSYPLYAGGKRSANLQASQEQAKIQNLQVDLQKQTLNLQTRNAYYEIQRADAGIEIARANLKNAETSLKDAQALRQAGFATIADVLQAQVQVANAQQQLVQTQGDLIAARSTLSQILSIPEDVSVTAAEAITLEDTWKLSLEKSLLLAYQQRPELQQELAQQKIAQAQREIALSEIRPQIYLIAQTDLQKVLNAGAGYPQGVEGGFWGTGYSVSAEIQWTFFNGGSSELKAQSAEVTEQIAVTQFAAFRNQIRQEVIQAYTNLQVNQENYKTALEAVNLAQQSLEANRLRFRAGVGTQLDVISAETNLNQARLNLLRAIFSYNQAIASLKKATGQND